MRAGRSSRLTDAPAPVAVDAMGGDKAPGVIVDGAVAAHRAGRPIVLVGDEELVSVELERHGLAPRGKGSSSEIRVVHADEVVGMGEDPMRAIRSKRRSSIAVCAELAASGECSGLVSAGSTGAAVTAAVLKMGRIRGVERPAIASVIPFPGHHLVLVDSGANPECRPSHLAQFAIMGAVFARHGMGVSDPRVGLLNIGEEAGKGAALHKNAYDLIAALAGPQHAAAAKNSPDESAARLYRFVGNIEGYHLPIGSADVAVTDGFTGNVVLKLVEGTAKAVVFELLAVMSSGRDELGMADLAADLREVKRRLNPDGAGGAYLLGVKGACVIAHGSSSAQAIEYAIKFACEGQATAIIDELTSIFGNLKDASVASEDSMSVAGRPIAAPSTAGPGARVGV